MRAYRAEHPAAADPAGVRDPVSWEEQVEEHRRALADNAKLKAEVEFLGKVSAFFAAKQR